MRYTCFVFLLLGACDPKGSSPSASYDTCSGDPFTGGDCADGGCAADGLSSEVYDVWRARFLEVHGLDEAAFTEHIEVTSVDLTEGPETVWWRVDYVFSVDWALSRQSESVDLGAYPLAAEPSEEEIRDAVDRALEVAERFDIAELASMADVEAALAECAASEGADAVPLDLCHLDFENSTGDFYGRGWGSIDESTCVSATVDLETAELTSCDATPCAIE